MYSRRDFLEGTLKLVGGYYVLPKNGFLNSKLLTGNQLMTVSGPIASRETGFTLSHEHVIVDFIGAANVSRSRYDENIVFEKALPVLQAAKTKGCNTFIDCTPAYIGRDVKLLKRLASATGLNIITNTGYYGAAKEKYIPAHAYTETASQIATRWIAEWDHGIEGSGIKPGFIKSGVDKYPLTEVQQKIVTAAALTHKATGLTIGIHTGDGKAAMEELKIISSAGVDPSAWIWIHAQNEKDRSVHLHAARAGGWVSFDGYTKAGVDDYIQFLNDMKKAGFLSKVLISHDSGWYHVGEDGGGNFRGYNDIIDTLVPAMHKSGFTAGDIKTVFHINPANAFTIRKRLVNS